MKIITTITFLLLSMQGVFANAIDNLKTIEDVEGFLVEKVNKKWTEYDFFESSVKDSSYQGKNNFFKVDLDNNGLTDLVVNGKYFFAVTDNGNKTYSTHFVDGGGLMSEKYTLTNIIYADKTPLLLIKEHTKKKWQKIDTTRTDTIILKFGHFIEYNLKPDNLTIDEINFSTSGCYGTCPIFKISIKADRSATFEAIRYNNKEGKFKATIDRKSYKRLLQTIDYIKLSTLKDYYRVNWTDDQTVMLAIKFNGGQTKTISDYGLIGTFGLSNLYGQLFALRKTQKWK